MAVDEKRKKMKKEMRSEEERERQEKGKYSIDACRKLETIQSFERFNEQINQILIILMLMRNL